jgi:hypothetical protein
MYEELFDATVTYEEGTRLEDVFESYWNPTDDELRKQLSSPEMLPQPFDVTFEGWLKRLSLWGDLKVTWNNPEGFGKKKINKSQFIRQLSDPNLLKAFGKWQFQQYHVNKMDVYRKYVGLDGKKRVDKYRMEIKLKPELKQALKRR